jgi:hypothetical protein
VDQLAVHQQKYLQNQSIESIRKTKVHSLKDQKSVKKRYDEQKDRYKPETHQQALNKE